MARKNLFAKERLNFISALQIRFDKLQKETGVLSGALPAQADLAPTLSALAVLPKVLADNGIGPNIVLDKDEEEQNKEE